MQFSAPSSGGGSSVTVAELEGHLVVVEPLEYVPAMPTSFGEKDALRVNVHDITAQESHEDVLFFGRALIGSLKSQVDKKVLGVIGKGVAKPGQAAPWILTDASTVPEAVQAATAYLTGQVAASMSAPAAPEPTPAPAGGDALAAALGNLQAAGLSK